MVNFFILSYITYNNTIIVYVCRSNVTDKGVLSSGNVINDNYRASDECNHCALKNEVCEYESPYAMLSEAYDAIVPSSLSITDFPNEYYHTKVVNTAPNSGKLLNSVNVLK